MADDVTIPDLKEKLRVLKDTKEAQDIGGHTGGQPSFAKAIGVSRSTVRDWLSPDGTRRSVIPGTINGSIADRFKFPADWPLWLTQSAAVFEVEFLKRARTQLAQSGTATAPRSTTAPLRQGEHRDPERCPIRSLASIELTCGQTGEGYSDIGARISCGISLVDGSPFPVTVHTAMLEIDCGKARAVEDTIKALDAPGFTITGSKGEVRGMWNGGDTQRLAWLLDATSPSLGVVTFEPGMLARVEGIAPSDVIAGSIGTWLKNIESDDKSPARPADVISIVDRTAGKQIELPEDRLSELQKRIMEHLRKRVLEIGDDGFAVLARHELEFVKRPE